MLVSLIQVFASFFGLVVVTSVLIGVDIMTPIMSVLNTPTGFIFLLIFTTLLFYDEDR